MTSACSNIRTAIRWSIVAVFLSCSTALVAADLLDVPGQGYQQQAESLRARPIYRLDLLDALPPSRLSTQARAAANEWLLQRLERFERRLNYRSPRWLSLELNRLDYTLPKLPTENPFAHPIRLFGSPAPSASFPETLPWLLSKQAIGNAPGVDIFTPVEQSRLNPTK